MNRPFRLPNAAPDWWVQRAMAQNLGLPRGWIDGFTLSNDATDATNDIGIAAGACRSSFNLIDGAASTEARHQIDIVNDYAAIKQLDVAFAPHNRDGAGRDGGGRSGGLIGTIANGTWHTYAIGGLGVPGDYMFLDSAVQATVVAALPNGYTAARRIGSIIRASAAIVTFVQHGDLFWRKVAVKDAAAVAVSTTAVDTQVLSVPLGIRVEAIVNGYGNALAGTGMIHLYPTDVTDTVMTTSDGPGSVGCNATGAAGGAVPTQRILTDTSGQISMLATEAATINLWTLGWVDQRGKNG